MMHHGKIRRLAAKIADKMKDREFFASNPVKDFLQTIVTGVSKRYARPVHLIFTDAIPTACTDGSSVMVNVNHESMDELTRPQKFRMLIGRVLHEVAHILYTDFRMLDRWTVNMTAGDFRPAPQDKAALKEFQDWKDTHEDAGEVIQTLVPAFTSLVNFAEDGYVDMRVITDVPGYGKDRIYCKEIMFQQTPPLSSFHDKWQRVQAACGSYMKYGMIKGDASEFEPSFTDEYIPLMQAAVYEKSTDARFRALNGLFVRLYLDYIIPALEKGKTADEMSGSPAEEGKSSSGGPSGMPSPSEGSGKGHAPDDEDPEKSPDDSYETKTGGDKEGSPESGKDKKDGAESGKDDTGSDKDTPESPKAGGTPEKTGESSAGSKISLEEFKAAVEELAKKMKELDREERPEGKTAPVDSGDAPDAEEGETAPDTSADRLPEPADDTDRESLIERLKALAAEEEARDEIEKGLEKELKRDDHETEQSSISRARCIVKRAAPYEHPSMAEKYREELLPVSKRIQKRLLDILEEQRRGSKMTGLYAGRRFDPRSFQRTDGRHMYSRKAPENVPDMAVCLLVDESGSMGGGNIEAARATAYIVHDFCLGLDIPVAIYGHTERFRDGVVELRSYAEFDSVDGKDKERILGLAARENNRDGYAIRFCQKRLASRQEEVKLLLIVSDGAPEASGYYGSEANQDVRDAVAAAIKSGQLVITAGIGSCRSEIESVYIDPATPNRCAKFLDIADLEKMPKQFIRIIQRRMDL